MNKMKLAMAILETLFAIPILGALVIVGLLWIPLIIALAGHIVTLVLANKAGQQKRAPIMGIIASTVGLIPGVGIILHTLTAIFSYIEAFKE